MSEQKKFEAGFKVGDKGGPQVMSEREDEAKRQQQKREQGMIEPITVADALKALRMAKEVDGHAEAGPWARPDDVFDPEDADAIVLWRQCFGGMVEYLIVVVQSCGMRVIWAQSHPALHSAIAPIVQWARTREEWSR